MKKYLLKIGLIILAFFSITSCKKTEPYSSPLIDIVLPTENAFFQLPGYIEVQVTVLSDRNLNYVKLSIDNEQLVPISSTKFFYPDSNFVLINYDFHLEQIPPGQNDPFYLHVAVDDGIELNHAYQQINLNNADITFKGFYLFSQPLPNQVQIDYFDNQNGQQFFATLPGEYVDSDVSSQQGMLYLASNRPANLYAFEHIDQKLKWTKEPSNPYPEYSDLLHSGNNLYNATGNSHISNVSDVTGYVKVITPFLPDSAPSKIGVADDFFIADFWVRNRPTRSWVTFYKITGQVFHRLSSDIAVVDFYQLEGSNGFSVIGNKEGVGIYSKYKVEEQIISDDFFIEAGEIRNSVELNSNEYLITIDRLLYRLNITGKSTTLLYEFPSEIVDINFDSINNNLYVLLANVVEIFSYPSMIKKNNIQSQHPLSGMELRFGY